MVQVRTAAATSPSPALVLALAAAVLLAALGAGRASAQGFLVPPADQPRTTFSLESQRVLIAVDEGVASYQVDQVFRNNTSSQLEATFYFPLPEDASLSEFSMWINGVKTRGELLERERAVEVYEEIVRRMVDPGILEYVGKDLIKARIFPIPPNGTQQVQVIFESLVQVDGQLAEVRYPLKAPQALAGTTSDLTVKAEIHSSIPIRTVYSPTHAVDVAPQDGGTVAGFEESGARFDRDFSLFYTLSREPVGVSLLTYRVRGEDGYFLMMASPGEEDVAPLPKDITFVFDTSGSMAGEKIQGARDALRFCLQSLSPEDRFNVVRFSTGVEPFSGGLLPASPDNVGGALQFVDRLEALGGTNIGEALDVALDHPVDPARPYYVVFMTDGLPTVGVTSADAILSRVAERTEAGGGKTRFFTFGVGYDVNTDLLDTLAGDNRGMAEYLSPGEDLEVKISAFYRKVSRPVLADVSLDLAGASAYDVYPRQLPDLFSGSQLIVMGRYKGSGSQKVSLSGASGSDQRTFATSVTFDKERADRAFIPRMWASRKVGFLLDEMRRNGEQPELVDEVIALSKRFGIMTPYTSFLVVEDTTVAERTPPADGPMIALPRGTTGGALQPHGNRAFDLDGAVVADDLDELLVLEAEESEASGGWGGLGTRGRGMGGGGAARKAAKESVRMQGFTASSGEAAVHTSQAIGDLKSKDKADGDTLSQVVHDKVFHYRSGAWVDESYDPSMTTLSVRYLSDGYFALLRLRPELARYVSLGEAVTVVVGGKAIVITADGDDPSESAIRAFLR